MGAMLFGLVYGYLALLHAELLFRSPFLLIALLVQRAVLQHVRGARLLRIEHRPETCLDIMQGLCRFTSNTSTRNS